MKIWAVLCAGLTCTLSPAAPNSVISDAKTARALKQKYVALTDSWAHNITFKPEEERAMQNGRHREDLMLHGLDDPLAKEILQTGEPSFVSLSASYPGKVLDRTLLGTYSDPRAQLGSYNDEFTIWWNGAISANLIKGPLTDRYGATGVQPVAYNTNILFRVGPQAEVFGTSGNDYSRIGYEDGYLPIVTATYTRDGVRYTQTAFAANPREETKGWDIAYVCFVITNESPADRVAVLAEDIILIDDQIAKASGTQLLNSTGAVLLTHNDPAASFDLQKQRLTHHVSVAPRQSVAITLKIPYIPDAEGLLHAASTVDFEAQHERIRQFWTGLLRKGVSIETPEERVNNMWRALLLQNFILADGPRFTYGSGLRYNDSTYPQENGFGAHVFALYGFKEYANALQPYLVSMSIFRDSAGRKYQNRRAMVLHHLLENYRLTGRTEVFERFKDDFYRVAEEIIRDRRSTMSDQDRTKLHWGLLPPDKPGVDIQASTQTVYVLGHNITNCQGLHDFGEFLIKTGVDPERGRRYRNEAGEFRTRLMEVMEKAAIRIPGRPPFVDLQTLYFQQTPDYGPNPYDDLALGRLQGTYFHYWVDMQLHYNFFNPSDQVGRWLADYVAQRGGFVLGMTRARSERDARYGWINNVYDGGYYNYRLRANDIQTFLFGFYARLAFGMSRHVYVASEGSPFIAYNTHDGGFVGADYSFPNSAANADTLLMLRNMLVLEELHDNEETGNIFLLRGAPRSWFHDGARIRLENLPSYFGDISCTVESSVRSGVIRASIQTPRITPYKQILIWLRHPKKLPIRSVLVNGATFSKFDGVTGLLQLSYGPAAYSVEVQY